MAETVEKIALRYHVLPEVAYASSPYNLRHLNILTLGGFFDEAERPLDLSEGG